MPEPRFVRVAQIRADTGVSKPKVFEALKSGKLDGLKLDGVLLITRESYERWLATAVPWKSR